MANNRIAIPHPHPHTHTHPTPNPNPTFTPTLNSNNRIAVLRSQPRVRHRLSPASFDGFLFIYAP